MNRILFNFLNLPWALLSVFLVVLIFFLLLVKDNRNIRRLTLRLKEMSDTKQITEAEVCNELTEYIKLHPLSLYNSDLRLSMITYLISQKADYDEVLNKIKIVDLHSPMSGTLIYVLFLMKENCSKHFDDFYKKASKFKYKDESFKIIEKNCIKNENFVNLNEISNNSPYFKAIVMYYDAKRAVESNDMELTKKIVEHITVLIHENSMKELLRKMGALNE